MRKIRKQSSVMGWLLRRQFNSPDWGPAAWSMMCGRLGGSESFAVYEVVEVVSSEVRDSFAIYELRLGAGRSGVRTGDIPAVSKSFLFKPPPPPFCGS